MENTHGINVLGLAYTPAETIELVSRAGTHRGMMRPDNVFFAAIYGGILLSFGAAASLILNAEPWYAENAPGIPRLAGALIFPVGLVLIVLTGAELFTASNMYTGVAFYHGRLPLWRMLVHWTLCWLGNLAGSLFSMAILFGYAGIFDTAVLHNEIVTYGTTRQVQPNFRQIFLRAIGCNMLVCLACFLAAQSKDLPGKILGVWGPICVFAFLGFDHAVANMFSVPLAIWHHTPGLSVGLYIWKGLIPATLGNIVGGAGFAGFYLWWFYIVGQPPILIDGTAYDEDAELYHPHGDGIEKHKRIRWMRTHPMRY